MPSSLNLNGLKVYRPAVYAEIDASALGGQEASTGNVCLVGSFPSFEQNEALTFTSAQSLVRYDHSDRELAHIGKVAFAPSLDERVPAGANTLTMLNVAPTTQAQLSIDDAGSPSAPALILKSKVWGSKGNRTQVTIENANTDQVNITVVRDGVSEVFEGIESDDVASISYEGNLLDVSSIEGNRIEGIIYSWTQEEAMSNGAVTFDVSDIVVDSELTLSLGSTAHSADVVVTVIGEDLSGLALTASYTFSAGDSADQSTSAFGSVSSIVANSTDIVYTGELIVSGSKTLDPADFNTLSEMIEAVDQFPSVSAVYTAGKDYAPDEFDAFSDSDISVGNGSAIVRCDLAEIIGALSSSNLVSAERATNGIRSVAQSSSGSLTAMLSGGSSSLPNLTAWETALSNIESSDIQIIVPWSGDEDVHGKIKAHLRKSALAGRERNAWLGAEANETLDQLYARAKSVRNMNDRNMALVGQSVKLIDPLGKTVTRDPMWLALMLACMQAGTPVATPLTRKYPDVVDVLGQWDGNKDASEAIRKGVCSLCFGPFGWRVERSVTTWLKDDNPIYSEVSANESINASVRDLRDALDIYIGDANRSMTANRIKSIVEARLNRQVLDGVIKAFKDVVLEDLGDTLNVNYTVASVEPINFIRITASVARF
jgi:hypothetical protein